MKKDKLAREDSLFLEVEDHANKAKNLFRKADWHMDRAQAIMSKITGRILKQNQKKNKNKRC